MAAQFANLTVALAVLLPFAAIAEPPMLVDPPDEIIDIREVIAKADDAASCEKVRELYSDTFSANAVPVAFADLLLTGRCLEKDLDAARSLLEKAAERGLWRANALARLGSLYEAGIGVRAEPQRATSLYRQAVGAMLPLFPHANSIKTDSPILSRIGGYTMSWSQDANIGIAFGHPADEAERWGMTIGEAVFNFVDSATGPWDLPPALLAERDKLAPLIEGSGEDHLAVARDFRYGSNGYPVDHAVSYAWIQHSASRPTSIVAMRIYLEWIQDPTFCTNRSLHCTASPVSSNLILADLAATGDTAALQALKRCVKASELSFEQLPQSSRDGLQRAYPDAPADQETLERARVAVLEKLEAFEADGKNADQPPDTPAHFLSRKVFGRDLPPYMFFWNRHCPL